jgi:hypothetical protein
MDWIAEVLIADMYAQITYFTSVSSFYIAIPFLLILSIWIMIRINAGVVVMMMRERVYVCNTRG